MPRAADSLQTIGESELDQLRGRDRDAISAQYDAHRDALERAARRVGFRGADAEELVQSVWATFLEIVPRFEGRSQVRTFLFGILRRKAGEARRATVRAVPTAPDTLDETTSNALDAHAALSDAELGHAVKGCVEKLPATQRRAVELKMLEDHDSEAVGRALGITTNYLGVLLHRARAHLRHCLTPHVA